MSALIGSAGILTQTKQAMKRAATHGLAFVLMAAIGMTSGIGLRLFCPSLSPLYKALAGQGKTQRLLLIQVPDSTCYRHFFAKSNAEDWFRCSH